MKKFLLIIFFIVLYSQGLISTIGIHPVVPNSLFLLIPLTILFLTKKNFRIAPGWQFLGLYVLWCVVAAMYHGEGVVRGLLFSRYLVIGYLVLWAIYNTYFSEKQILAINKIIFLMFFIQIPASIYEILVVGRTEAIVGIMFSGGGGPATTFPMFAFAFMFSFFLYRKDYKYLIAGLAFLIVGYASGKLGVYILVFAIAGIGLFLFKILEGAPILNKSVRKAFVGIFALGILALVILPSADVRTQRFDLKRLDLLERAEFFFDFATSGEKKSLGDRYTGSRTATSLRVIEETFSRPPEVFFFGNGFKAYESMGHSFGKGAFEEYGIVYGITGWSYDALTYGWPVMFFHVLFFVSIFYKIIKFWKKILLKEYWRIICFAIILNFSTFLLNYFFYNTNYTIGGWMIYVHMYFSAIILAPQNKQIITNSFSK